LGDGYVNSAILYVTYTKVASRMRPSPSYFAPLFLSFGSHVLLFVICFRTPPQYVIKSLQFLAHCELHTVSRVRSAEPHS